MGDAEAFCSCSSRWKTERKRNTEMQKRTNPLELKVESKDYTPAPAPAVKQSPVEPIAPAVEQPAIEPAPVIKEAPAEVAERAPQVHTAPAAAATEVKAPEVIPEVKEEKAAPAQAAPVQSAPQAVPAAPEAPVVPAAEESPASAPAAERVAPVRPNRPAPKRPAPHNAAEDKVRRGEQVEDNDIAVAVKFRVTGDRIDRRMVLTRVSRDVCKLAQSLYPEQSLGSIIEGALLTRAFLQDRAAFDAMAREIIEKGGKIKC